jgi:nucleoside 2-deoxyribosyltransferase
VRIYFAGSIRAGRDDVPVYQEIIRHLSEHGTVLTEHVGDYRLSVHGQSDLTDTFIHDRDVDWLLSSDVVVAEVTVPSLGVGYEIGTAVARGIPTIALYRGVPGQLSAMVNGSKGVQCLVYDHDNVPEALATLDRALKEFPQHAPKEFPQ